MPQGLQSELHLAVATATPPAAHPASPFPLLSIVVAQNALQRFTVFARGGEAEVEEVTKTQPTQTAMQSGGQSFYPPFLSAAAVTVQELGEKRRLAGQPLGLAWLGLGSIGCN